MVCRRPRPQARADQIRKVLASGGDAKALIKDTKDALDVDPLTSGAMTCRTVMKNAFDMKVGEWSQVADTPDALILFEVVNKGRLTSGRRRRKLRRSSRARSSARRWMR